MPTVHPTAIVDPAAQLAPDVSVGAYAVICGPVNLGPGCIVHDGARLYGPMTLGARNIIHSGAVLGGDPQDRKYRGEPSTVLIGDDNLFREGVTIHRGTGDNARTVIGHRNFFMVNAHVGHNCVVGNDVTLINGALLGGHVHVADRAIIGAHSAIPQFCRVGRLAMATNGSMFNVDLPPFFTSMSTNTLTQLNSVGLRRSGIPRSSINALRQMFQLAFRNPSGRLLRDALGDLPPDVLAAPEVQEVIDFVATTKRGIALFKAWSDRQLPAAMATAE